MPVDVSGKIVYNPDADDEYTLQCKQLGITESGTGTIEDDIETLREKVTNAIAEEFKVSPEAVSISGYSLNLIFSVQGPVNHTLDTFDEEAGNK
jgi:phosphosulfolactate synthase (CoM biosynthesis protein A)